MCLSELCPKLGYQWTNIIQDSLKLVIDFRKYLIPLVAFCLQILIIIVNISKMSPALSSYLWGFFCGFFLKSSSCRASPHRHEILLT